MKRRLTFGKSLSWGVTLAIGATVVAIVVAFMTGAELSVPGVIEIASEQVNGKPSTEFFFNPLGVIVLALLLGTAIWVAGRVKQGPQR